MHFRKISWRSDLRDDPPRVTIKFSATDFGESVFQVALHLAKISRWQWRRGEKIWLYKLSLDTTK